VNVAGGAAHHGPHHIRRLGLGGAGYHLPGITRSVAELAMGSGATRRSGQPKQLDHREDEYQSRNADRPKRARLMRKWPLIATRNSVVARNTVGRMYLSDVDPASAPLAKAGVGMRILGLRGSVPGG
jgi:hypothetical protein